MSTVLNSQRRGKVRGVILTIPRRVQNKNKENPRFAFFSPSKTATAGGGEEGSWGVGRNHSSVAGAELQISRNKFHCLVEGGVGVRHRVLAAGAGGKDQGCPQGRPQDSCFLWSSAQKGSTGKEVKVPQKKNIYPRQQRSLVKPEFLLQYPSLSLSRWLLKRHPPPPGRERAPAGGGARAVRGWGVHRGRQGRLQAPGGAGAVTTPRLPGPRPGPQSPKLSGASGQRSRVPRWGPQGRGANRRGGVPLKLIGVPTAGRRQSGEAGRGDFGGRSGSAARCF